MDFKKDLCENILPFWLKSAIDYKNGGIYTCLDREGNVYGTDKSVWFQGRALWSLCKAYNTVDKNPGYLKAAKCIYDFLPLCTDRDGRMFFTVTGDGREIQKRRYYFSETFAAIGCAEYYKAIGDKEIWQKAEQYFDVAYECFTGVRQNTPKFNPDNQKLKALSPVMIMLATAQTMRSVGEKRDKYDKIARKCLDEVLYGGFLHENALMESVTPSGEFVDSPTGRIVNPGHSMEAAWFVMLEGALTSNNEAILKGKDIIDKTWPLGWDKEHGGIIAFCDVCGKPPVQLEWDMKLWWPQCETMLAMRMAYMLSGEEKYLDMYNTVKDYCEKYFVDSKCGEWYGYLHYDNTVSNTLKGNIFKGPFHVPRLYILMSILDRTNDITKI